MSPITDVHLRKGSMMSAHLLWASEEDCNMWILPVREEKEKVARIEFLVMIYLS